MRLLINIIGLTFLITVFTSRLQERIFGNAISKGKISHSAIDEASGIACGITNQGYFWVHNDSGDDARVFLLDRTAHHRATYYLAGVEARDWEDMTTMQSEGKNYLLVGDIGDNLGRHATIKVHRFEEPTYRPGQVVDTIPQKKITTYTLTYEDGPRDAESMFFDPIDEKLYIISKRDLQAGVYETELPAENTADTLLLKRKASIPYTFITSADIAADGSEVLVKNLLNVYYWKRQPGESIVGMFKREGLMQPYTAEPQGEAITFARDGKGYYTTSERPFGLPAHIYFYPRLTKPKRS
ncbi:hypothetical protein H8S90_24720 [Olivibacter sp. SDN3]|uniref:hypothetical protein n=1 Tax=Olivibacter sp. SDN3 TaxID=2764720 RepID=UPI0016518714|nr:hypothetical protein [Olivibacter sp. SDN3]QNL49861.1 hypothetical protein H8S90_24720 [Olivibacter sp. SDN3]